MRRADRLLLLIQALRGRRSHRTAPQLADALEVSQRTIDRDIAVDELEINDEVFTEDESRGLALYLESIEAEPAAGS